MSWIVIGCLLLGGAALGIAVVRRCRGLFGPGPEGPPAGGTEEEDWVFDPDYHLVPGNMYHEVLYEDEPEDDAGE